MMVSVYLDLLTHAEQTLAQSLRQVADGHGEEPDVYFLCQTLAGQCDEHVQRLQPIVANYGRARSDSEPERLYADTLGESRRGPVGLLRDLQDVHMLATFVESNWVVVGQAAAALHDRDLLIVVSHCKAQTHTQIEWLTTWLKQAAPQALVV
jgi:hypothetical protein